MDPMIISLIFQGLRLAGQVASQGKRATAALSELEAFLVQLHEEGRDPTPDEMRRFTGRTAELDSDFKRKLEALKQLIADGGGPVPPAPAPRPVPVLNLNPDAVSLEEAALVGAVLIDGTDRSQPLGSTTDSSDSSESGGESGGD